MALLLAMHDHGYTLAAVVFCMLLVAVGHLAYRSTRYPRILSTLLIVSFIVATVTKLLWPDLPTVIQTILAPPAVADLWLVAYLVIRGGIGVPANNFAPTAIPCEATARPRPGEATPNQLVAARHPTTPRRLVQTVLAAKGRVV